MRIAFDMSSFLWTSLSVGKDAEFGFEVPHPAVADKKIYVNTAKYGYENIINAMCAVLRQFDLAPIDMLLVFEGMHSKSRRRQIEASYKEDTASEVRAPEAYLEFEKLRTMMIETWGALGATCLQQDYVEGDDVLAWLAQETEEDLVIATGDRDLTILNGTNAHGAKIMVRYKSNGVDIPIGENPYGPWDLKLISVYKALVGDSGDKIKGVVGFGDTKWIQMLATYGEEGLFEIDRLLRETSRLGDLHTQVDECKLIKLICSQEDQCVRSYKLGLLHPEWVNTMINPLQFTAGMVREAPAKPDERLAQWYQRKRLVTADLLTQATKNFILDAIKAAPFVAFDIETSTSDESDEWVDRQSKDPDETDRAVDVYGSELTGFSITCGVNLQQTFYFPVNHAQTSNISKEDARTLIEMPSWFKKRLVIQNFSFEACVCYHEFGEHWLDNGYEGFLPDIDDTKLMSSYVDENNPLGLKWRSENVLRYKQVSYDEVTKVASVSQPAYPGGVQIRVYDAAHPVGSLVDGEMQYPMIEWVEMRYKMRELPATHVFDYGCDDTICTAGLYVYNRLIMELEHSWKVYRDVEIDSAYQHAVNFECGIAFSVEKSNELSKIDDETYDASWKVVRQFLIDNHYEGTEPPEFDYPLTAADIKVAFTACFQKKLDTAVRTMSKLITFIREVANEPTFALVLAAVVKQEGTHQAGEAMTGFNAYVAENFKGEPESPIGSPKKMAALLYETMKLPVRVRNKATDNMRMAGIFEGNPKTDALSIEYALKMDASDEHKAVLEAMKLMQMVRTRRSLYYTKYKHFMHWKDGLIRPSHNQCATNTRRASASKPNSQQLPKHAKVEGQAARFRETIVPHARNAVVVSMDFVAQELRIIAEQSQDPNLIACYVGADLRDVHALTGLGIFNYKAKKRGVEQLTYEQFEVIRLGDDKMHPLFQYVKEDRVLGKKVVFTTEFGAMAPKVAQTLLVSEEEAQAFIDARESAFARVKVWKEEVIVEAKRVGYVRSMLGAMRHLRPLFTSTDAWVSSKAERQAVNFKVQGSAAEQTKLAEARMWRDRLFFDFDAVCYGAIHDEAVASVLIADLPRFLPRMHACMVENYAGMKVPNLSSVSFGPNFYQQIEIGNTPSKEAIDKGLVQYCEMMAA